MSQNIPDNLLYTEEHEWVDPDTGWMGITDYAQDELGDVVFVELPEVGRELSHMEAFMIVESVKAVSDIYAPMEGTVAEINSDLENRPELINESPYEEGRMVRIDGTPDEDALMDADAYSAHLE